ncbi:hypothetical protein TI39_contig352g00062 [Zymoseptoria brevis]|uniref:Cryptic loci regulator 2 N-terminal domain-containing protein n=1 Tax=Zymoseptoria brevis TaxID=1047168 RepID=A0A0F4GQK4_9PEZI|nr:hypothetical protein TI39_contig352g00062 [Zymoseptoria brevis]
MVIILQVGDASDGTNATPAVPAIVRNDAYFLDALGDRWAKDQGIFRPGQTYRLDRLPAGYGGFEKNRENSKHVDRYLYGHPNGVMRSLNEAFPHFKYLQEHGGAIGCDCKLCSGKKPVKTRVSSGSPAVRTQAPVKQKRKSILTHGEYLSDSSEPRRSRQVDQEGMVDVYRLLLDKVKEAGTEGSTLEMFADQVSPDWRAGHELVEELLSKKDPMYSPRYGELVLFTRSGPENTNPRWEVGVVTQLPVEPISDEDLLEVPPTKTHNVSYSGFRVEPMPEPNNNQKQYSSQHKYVPLHSIRPLSLWRHCLKGDADSQTHPTLRHALTVASSFCTVGPIKFQGTWPSASLYMRGCFIGPELVVLGDTVRLMPRLSDDQDSVTDIMIISSIRLRFVNMDEANDDDYDGEIPYNTCLHVLGKAYTLNPAKGHRGDDTKPALPRPDLAIYGTWYPMVDPDEPKAKLEIPFARILGKCFEESAMEAWLSPPSTTPASSFQAVNARPMPPYKPDFSRGLEAIREARQYSADNDSRIDRESEKSWFWAETRIEQLDLHEVNGRFVGVKDQTRDKVQMKAWRQALKVLDGKKGSSEAYAAAIREREVIQQSQSQQVGEAFGMMGGAQQQADRGTEGEASGRAGGEADIVELEDDDVAETEPQGDAMDVDGVPPSQATPKNGMLTSIPKPIDLSDDEEDQDELMTGWGIRGT